MQASNHPATMRTLICGGLVLGTLDLVFAWAFWANKGVGLQTILHSIAAGWFGDRSHEMGGVSAGVGALSHYLIAIAFVGAYWMMARRRQVLVDRPIAWGAVYGLLLYALMNFVVVPLSAAGMPSFGNTPWVVSSIVVHALLGIVAAWFARRALRG